MFHAFYPKEPDYQNPLLGSTGHSIFYPYTPLRKKKSEGQADE